MTEIDKIVNQAFPDELRRVRPIPVDEEKILSRTFEKLGLEKVPAQEPARAPGRRGRYVQRHGKRRAEEPALVAVAIEPARPVWRALAGWALAACLLLACGIGFGPALLRSLPWEKTGGVMAGGAAQPHTAGSPETTAEDAGENEAGGVMIGGADQEDLSGSAAPDLQKRSQEEREQALYAALDSLRVGLDATFAQGQDSYDDVVSVVEVTPLDELDCFTATIKLPYYSVEGAAQLEIDLIPKDSRARAHISSRENGEGYAKVTFSLSNLEEDYVAADLIVCQMDGNTYANFYGFSVFIDVTGPYQPSIYPFSGEELAFYIENGYSGTNAMDNDGPPVDGDETAGTE